MANDGALVRCGSRAHLARQANVAENRSTDDQA